MTENNIKDTELLNEEPGVILPFEKNGEYYIDSLGELPKKPVYEFIKRTFDLFASAIGLIICLVPMLIIAVLVKTTSKGPVIYRQERLAHSGVWTKMTIPALQRWEGCSVSFI